MKMITVLLLIISIANAEGIYSEAKSEVKRIMAEAILNEKPCNAPKPIQNKTATDKLSSDIDMRILDEKFKNLKVIVEAENQATLSMVLKKYRKCKYHKVVVEESAVAPCESFLNNYKKNQPKWIDKVDKEILKKCPKDIQLLNSTQKAEIVDSLMKDDTLLPKQSVKKIVEKL
ncbi:hypothetical protein KM1_262350 [Entamoeba histolytica HM-3:IMSS]|uniref:Uncharacterized protein n=1 Tax=Entamoeba histolytica HM-3:IMSS TaxID=885315 RepID=M7W2U4_ENTHI|nr:hypothetical protein KM1_262350 [Entamoeba histolytica HM-3:IMSS]